MINKKFTLGDGSEVVAKELTVGTMMKVKKLLEDDEMGATLFMIKSSLGVDDKFVENIYMSDMQKISDWLGNPTAD